MDLSYSKINDSSIETLAPLIRNLKYLNLAQNNLTKKGAGFMAEILKEGADLNILILDENDLCNEGVLTIISALNNNYKLHSLSLNEVNVGDSGKIISSLVNNISIAKFSLLGTDDTTSVNDIVNLLKKNNYITSLR